LVIITIVRNCYEGEDGGFREKKEVGGEEEEEGNGGKAIEKKTREARAISRFAPGSHKKDPSLLGNQAEGAWGGRKKTAEKRGGTWQRAEVHLTCCRLRKRDRDWKMKKK